LPKFYAMADLFVLPSFYDTFGVVVDEAMASGLPVVTTTRVGAVADLVRDGENGRVVPPGDAEALADAVREILSDAELRQRMSLRASKDIRKWTVEDAAAGFLQCVRLFVTEPEGKAI
jgi:glycosyltransferase involved in cell wall biosynthesis